MEKTMDKIVALAKARGFVYAGSEIYGGLANTWDYGNLGVELKNNVKKAWWQKFVMESPYNVGVDCAILMNPQTWVASGRALCNGTFRAGAVQGLAGRKKAFCRRALYADHLRGRGWNFRVCRIRRAPGGRGNPYSMGGCPVRSDDRGAACVRGRRNRLPAGCRNYQSGSDRGLLPADFRWKNIFGAAVRLFLQGGVFLRAFHVSVRWKNLYGLEKKSFQGKIYML